MPVAIEVIKRCIELWTYPNDIVLDPFNGIGSSTYMALKMNRRAMGIELKDTYFDQSVKNCENALKEPTIQDLEDFNNMPDLFEGLYDA